MARDVIDRELNTARTGRRRFSAATEADDAEIRRLLRENMMPGRISLSLEREPYYFADAQLPGEAKQTIVACDAGRVVCVGSCTVRERFVNGKPTRVGYLGGLRLDARHAGRFDLIRGGYEFFRELQTATPGDFYFTSIATDNTRARAFLERGLPGMPVYEFLGEYVTVLLSTDNQHKVQTSGSEPLSPREVISFLNRYNSRYQLSPCWTLEELNALEALGLRSQDFQFVGDHGETEALAALWDQRVFKQAVIRGYASPLNQVRPILNLASRLIGGTRLPAVGETLASAFVSHVAVEAPGLLIRLVRELRRVGHRRGMKLVTLGFAASDPRLAVLRKSFRAHEYHSRIYVVRWPGCGGAAQELDGRVLAPEVALL